MDSPSEPGRAFLTSGTNDDRWNPEQYERFRSERSKPFFDLMDLVHEPARERIVDLGCGTGELTKVLHERFGARRTLGIDSSASMLAKAGTFAGQGLEFEARRIEEFADRSAWDLVFSNAALQWCGGHDELLPRLARSLAPGGELVVQMPANHDYATHVVAEEVAALAPFRARLESARGTPVASPEVYAELLYRAGLADIDVFVRVYPHVLPSREDVIEWVKGTLLTYYQSRLEPSEYERFFEAYVKALFAKLPDQRPFFYPFKRLFLRGRRQG